MKSICIHSICLLYLLLFVYAATSKLLDLEKFHVQLSQSPLLSEYASFAAWLVPLSEYIIAGLLVFSHTRQLGLFAACTLMMLFTGYIFLITHFLENIPCSCGGVLQKMSWSQHFVFNLFFVALGALGVLLAEPMKFQHLKSLS